MINRSLLCRYECHHCARAFKSWQARNIHEDNCEHAPEEDRNQGYVAVCADGHIFTQSPAKPFCGCGKGLDLGSDPPTDEPAPKRDRRPQWRKRAKVKTKAS